MSFSEHLPWLGLYHALSILHINRRGGYYDDCTHSTHEETEAQREGPMPKATQPRLSAPGSGAPDLVLSLPPRCLCLSPASGLGSEGSAQGFDGQDEFSHWLTEDTETGWGWREVI